MKKFSPKSFSTSNHLSFSIQTSKKISEFFLGFCLAMWFNGLRVAIFSELEIKIRDSVRALSKIRVTLNNFEFKKRVFLEISIFVTHYILVKILYLLKKL